MGESLCLFGASEEGGRSIEGVFESNGNQKRVAHHACECAIAFCVGVHKGRRKEVIGQLKREREVFEVEEVFARDTQAKTTTNRAKAWLKEAIGR